jgi:uncharacterized protein DUF2612
MSGPNYPRYAPGSAPGGNAIGSFIIGESPIGTISPFDIWTTIISEYANSPTITALCTNMGQYVDPTRDLDSFFDSIFNIDTAIGYGLDVWGRILGITRILQLPIGTGPFLGFEEAATPSILTPFGQGPFFSGQSLSNNFSLQDPQYRQLLLAKALANICDGSIPMINQLLLNLFPGLGTCYVADGENLTMTYTFKFPLTPVQLAIVQNSGVLPRTSGVAASVSVQVPS